MKSATLATEQTWRCLWSHAAYDIISSFPSTTHYDRIQVGSGWGFRNPANHHQAHPSGNGREVGDLSLTVLGQGTQVIPRCSYSYPNYLDEVIDIITTTARVYMQLDATDTID
jgi:hypothetical protein